MERPTTIKNYEIGKDRRRELVSFHSVSQGQKSVKKVNSE